MTLKEFQMLPGHLNFACRVVVAGRAFCNCLHAAKSAVRRPYHFIWMTREIKEDLQVRETFLQVYNVVSFWRQPMALHPLSHRLSVGLAWEYSGGGIGALKPCG